MVTVRATTEQGASPSHLAGTGTNPPCQLAFIPAGLKPSLARMPWGKPGVNGQKEQGLGAAGGDACPTVPMVLSPCFGRRENKLRIQNGWLCHLAPEIIRQLSPDTEEDKLPFSKHSDVFALG